jgi:phage terminase large subunit-like protein
VSTKSLHPAEQYVRDVIAGRIRASRWVKLACERHIRDLANGKSRGLYFDVSAAQDALDFFPLLRHSKGKDFAGKPVILEPWEQFNVWSLFGWKRANGTRRFRSAHIEIAKKNGKSTLCGGLGMKLAFFDGEPGAEVYCAATKKDQAKLVFAEAESMRAKSPALRKAIVSYRNNMHIPSTNSKFEPLGADDKTLDGPNIHGLIFDEMHAHKSRALWDTLEQGTASRTQPMTVAITTAGYDRETVCWAQHEYGQKVLEGINEDDSFFVYIACLDEGDDWEDERNWIKANPNLGVSVRIDELRERANKAKNDPSSLNAFLRLRLNVWTNQETAAIKMDDWNACVGFSLQNTDSRALQREMEDRFAGQPCFIGVDLSSTEDITAMVKLFPPQTAGEKYVVIADFWMPEDNIERKVKEFRAPYDVWVREDFIHGTPGNIVDYDFIRAKVLADFEKYDVRELAFDPWNATQFANDLQKGGINADRLVKFNQTIGMFAEPTKRLIEELVLGRRLAHLGNPVLRWMASNLVVWEDGNGNKRPTKKSARGKIDGIVATIMALGRSIATPSDGGSLYADGQGVFCV